MVRGLVLVFNYAIRSFNGMRTVRHLAFHSTSFFEGSPDRVGGRGCCQLHFDLEEGVLIL